MSAIMRLRRGEPFDVRRVDGADHRACMELVHGVYVASGYIEPCADGVHVSRPQWQADGAGTFTGAVRAFAEFGGYLWAAGEVGGLWRREPDGWSLYDALADVECVWDMAEVDGRLLLACRYDNDGADSAGLLALSIDEGGQFVCGPTPPDVYLTLLTSTRAR